MCIRGKQTGKEFSFVSLSHIVQRGDFNNLDVVLTGGEPTQYSKLNDVVKLISKYAHMVAITTNGTDNDIVKEWTNTSNLVIQVSLDGDRETHDAIRGAGTFDKVINTIDNLEKYRIPYIVASVVNKNNTSGIFDLGDILKNYQGMKYWNISYEMPFGSSCMDNSMTVTEWNDFVDSLIGVASVRVKIKKLFPFDLYEKFLDKIKIVPEKNRSFNCGSGRDKLYIYPDFSVYPCTCLEDFCIGNLELQSLKQILENNLIKVFQNYHVNSDSVCASCRYLDFCRGGCIGMSVHYNGGLGNGDIRCPYVHSAKSGKSL